MCIAIISNSHPAYALILLDNRDEFLNRPTAPAAWWAAPDGFVLGGRDLLRPVQGTWLGLTQSGRIAVLTNYREDDPPTSAISRGVIIKDFLTDTSGRGTEEYVRDLVGHDRIGNVGGFSLVCGRMGEGLRVVSNRNVADGDDPSSIPIIMRQPGETVGLSNAAFGHSGWKKVEDGERLLAAAIQQSAAANETEAQLIARCLDVLNTDTLPRTGDLTGGLESYIGQLRNTIFVPALGTKATTQRTADQIAAAQTNEKVEVLDEKAIAKSTPPPLGTSGLYGTQKQTVVLVEHGGRVRFVERTLYDSHADPVPAGSGKVDITFHVESEAS